MGVDQSGKAPSPRHVTRRGKYLRLGALCLALLAALPFFAAVNERAVLTAPQATPILYDRNGAFLTQIGVESGGDVKKIDFGYWPLDHIPTRVAQATLALEDSRFQYHPGVDPLAAGRALWRNAQGRGRSGASTIAMQTARMQRPGPRSLASKLTEAATALALTLRFGRGGVLAHYLRIVPYGNGSHGIAHAARFYFDKPVDDLSWAEIALLSGVPQSPTRMNLLQPAGLERAKKRGHRALNALARQDVLPRAELALAHRQLTAMPAPQPQRRPDALHAVLRYEVFAREGRLTPASPYDPRIRTTLDLEIQKNVTLLTRRYLAGWRGLGAEQAAALVVERRTGRVLASVGSAVYNGGHAGALDFTLTQRSPGSALKPFIYALALERGVIKPSDILADLPEGSSGINNADEHFLGPMLARQALANSRNVPATNLLRRTGLETTFRFLRALGLHDLEGPADSFGLSMAIGSLPTNLERLTRAYSVLAEDGMAADLVWHDGQRRREPQRVMSQDSARLVTSFLSDPLARLPSFPRFGALEYPFPVAVKTGTSQGYRDAWTVAFSGDYLVGVWVGREDAGTMARLSGIGSAARLAHAVLMQLHKSKPGELSDVDFPAPAGRVAAELCVYNGLRSTGDCGQTLSEWVRPDEMPALAEAPVINAAATRRVTEFSAPHRAWAFEAGFRLSEPAQGDGPARFAIAAPENNTHIWRNPDTPPGLARIALKAIVSPKAEQVVWYVDGAPFAITDPDRPVMWPVEKGAHSFQLRLPLQPGGSRVVRIVVE